MPGIPTSSSTPSPTGRCCPSSTSNGYKISNPTLLSRITSEEVRGLFKGCGWTPCFVRGRRRP
ncbi:MAG: hypothetical protein ACLRWQ_19525 [Flavonifractor plautii]